jgi:hypothetical protein
MNEHGFLARFRETRALVIIREWKLKGSGVEALKSYSVTRQKTRKRMGFGHENWVKLGSFSRFHVFGEEGGLATNIEKRQKTGAGLK